MEDGARCAVAKVMSDWIDNTGALGSNFVLEGAGFYISFNPCPGGGSFFGSDDGGPETALCEGDNFHILNGDYRAQYEKLLPQGLEACMRFYAQQSAHADSSWSSTGARA